MDITSYLLGKQAGGGGGQPSLQSKSITITENGTQNVTADSGYDGLSNVSVTTNVGGGDLSEYFQTEITTSTSSSQDGIPSILFKKIPTIHVADSVTMLSWCFGLFYGAVDLIKITGGNNVMFFSSAFNNTRNAKKIDLSEFNFSKITSLSSVFVECYGLKELYLNGLNMGNIKNVSTMFNSCTALEKLDIRNLILEDMTSYSNMFGSGGGAVPTTCQIIVKDATSKAWLNTNFPAYTNVKTVAEYETE